MTVPKIENIVDREAPRFVRSPTGLYVPDNGISRRAYLRTMGGVMALAAGQAGCATYAGPGRAHMEGLAHMEELGINVFRVTDDDGATAYIALTPEGDSDELSAQNGRGTLQTDYTSRKSGQYRQKVYDVSLSPSMKEKEFKLKVTVNGRPVEQFLEEVFGVKPSQDGIYSNILNPEAHFHYYWNPGDNHFVGALPPSYHIRFVATDGQSVNSIETGTSVLNQLVQYVKEINPDNASDRNTNNLLDNIALGWRYAGRNLEYFLRSLTIGYRTVDIHSGKLISHRGTLDSLVKLVPDLLQGEFRTTLTNLSRIPGGIVDAWGYLLSAISNSIINSVTHLTVGFASPSAASYATDAVGTLLQIHAKNLPFGERSIGVLSPRTYIDWRCAHCTPSYTGTPLQKSIDFVATAGQAFAIYKLVFEKDSNKAIQRRRRAIPEEKPTSSGGGEATTTQTPAAPAPAPATSSGAASTPAASTPATSTPAATSSSASGGAASTPATTPATTGTTGIGGGGLGIGGK